MSSTATTPVLDWWNPQSDQFQTIHQATDNHGRHYRIVTALASTDGRELVSWMTVTTVDDEGKRTELHQGRYATTQGSKVAAAAWSKNNVPA